jgi:methionyl-tRNA formyltransferase
MKYVFFGTPRFAEIALEGLLNADIIPVALVCNPDRPVGRKKIITPPATKQLITSRNLSTVIMQPEKLDDQFIEQLKELQPDIFVVAAYAKIIPDEVLKIPRLGTLGTHPSLLSKYRGASPIQSVILAGETVTGSSIYQMDAFMDHGAILTQDSIILDSLATNYLTLEKQLAVLSAKLLIKTFPKVLDGTIKPLIQDESEATFTKKFKTQDGFIDPSILEAAIHGNHENAQYILRAIHALNPEPGIWTIQNGKRLKLLEATIINGSLKLSKTQREGEAVTKQPPF